MSFVERVNQGESLASWLNWLNEPPAVCWSVILGDLSSSWKGVFWTLPEAFRTGPPSWAVHSMSMSSPLLHGTFESNDCVIKKFNFFLFHIVIVFVGRQYDKDGNLRQWWNNETINAFRERAQCIIDQYSSYTLEPFGYQVRIMVLIDLTL